ASFRGVDHLLHFSIDLSYFVNSNRGDKYLSANVSGQPVAPSGPMQFAPSPLQGPSPINPLGYGPPDLQQAGVFNSQGAEVAYFLRPVLDVNTGLQLQANGTPLYALYRRQLLVLNPGDNPAPLNTGNNRVPVGDWPYYADVSCQPDITNPSTSGFLYFNTMA